MSQWGTGGVPYRVRKRILNRDNHTCQQQDPGCTITATEVDHITNLAALGITRAQAMQNEDDNNLRAICTTCHKTKSERERQAGFEAYQQHRRDRKRLPAGKHPGDF